jgi:hypothetical protein
MNADELKLLDEALALIRNHRHVAMDARMKKLDDLLSRLRATQALPIRSEAPDAAV